MEISAQLQQRSSGGVAGGRLHPGLGHHQLRRTRTEVRVSAGECRDTPTTYLVLLYRRRKCWNLGFILTKIDHIIRLLF